MTGVQTCALPILADGKAQTTQARTRLEDAKKQLAQQSATIQQLPEAQRTIAEIGRASCRERV